MRSTELCRLQEVRKMKGDDETKEQLIDELAEMRQRVAGLKAADTEHKRAKRVIPERQIGLYIAGMFVLLCIVVWLNEISDLPHLLLRAPHTPINWREAVIEMILIASTGFFVLLRLSRDITERQRAEEETRQRALEQETLRNAALALTTALDRNKVIERILLQLQQVVPYDSASVQLLRENRMEIVGGRGFSNLPDLLGISFPVNGDNPNSEVARTRAPFIVKDALAVYEEFRKDPHRQTIIRSWLGVPMLIGERLVGMIALDKSESGFYTQEHARLAEAFAAQAAIAIENARLYEAAQQELADRKRAEEALRQRHRELTTLYEATTTISSDLSLNAVLQAVARQMTQALDSSGCVLSLWDRDNNLLETVVDYHKDAPAETESPGTTYDLNDYPITRRVLETGRPIVIQRGDPTADETEVALMESQNVLVLLMLPLTVHDRVVGLIELVNDTEAHEYTPEQIRLAESLAAQAAIAIENARLFEESEERRVYLEGVLGAAPDAIVTLDAHHRIVEWNSGAEKLFGYSQEEVVGRNLDYLVTSADVLEEALEFTQVVMSGLEIPPVETVRYRKDGSPVDVILAASPILVRDELIGMVIVYTDITLRKRMEETLRALLLIDDLTGLYNRRGFFTLGQQQLKTANRTKMTMLLLFADFDDLKQINDTFGHPEGDRALVETAQVFRETFRESDIIARIAGDEFAVLAVETDKFSSDILATRLQENLEARNARKGRRYKLSLSTGLARYDPKHPCSIDELLARADKAMYEQKQRSQQQATGKDSA